MSNYIDYTNLAFTSSIEDVNAKHSFYYYYPYNNFFTQSLNNNYHINFNSHMCNNQTFTLNNDIYHYTNSQQIENYNHQTQCWNNNLYQQNNQQQFGYYTSESNNNFHSNNNQSNLFLNENNTHHINHSVNHSYNHSSNLPTNRTNNQLTIQPSINVINHSTDNYNRYIINNNSNNIFNNNNNSNISNHNNIICNNNNHNNNNIHLNKNYNSSNNNNFNYNNISNNNSNINTHNSNNNSINANNISNNINNNFDNLFKIAHWNCDFIRYKCEAIKDYIKLEQPDIFCINEVGVNNDKFLNDWFHNIPYKMFHNLRNGRGGGVLIFIKEQIQAEEIIINKKKLGNKQDPLEIVGIKININNFNFHIFSYYNSPSDTLDENTIIELYQKYKNMILIGDLNALLTNYGASKNNTNGNILESILDKTELIIQDNKDPTFCQVYWSNVKNTTIKYESVLDYTLASPSIANKISSYNIIKDSILSSDHYLIECKLIIPNHSGTKNINKINKMIKKFFNFEIANWEFFQNKLESECNNCYNENEVKTIDNSHKFITEIFKKATEKCIPIIKINENQNYISCLPKYLVLMRKQRNKLQNKMRSVKDANKRLSLRREYYLAHHKFLEELKKFKSNQWNKFMNDLANKQPLCSKAFWRRIKRIRSHKRSNNIPTLIDQNNAKLDDDKKKATFFLNKLANTFKDNDDYCKTFCETKLEEIKRWKNSFDNINLYDEHEDITIRELQEALKKINNKTSLDLDNLNNKLLKNSTISMQYIILNLFNKVLKEKKYPKAWKVSQITMIPKKGDSWNPKNYRPISITSCLLRLFEKIIHIRLEFIVESSNILTKFQSGFRNKRQTKDNLLFLCQKTLEKFNHNKKMCAIFYDIASAFDKVWLDGLLFKLNEYKIPIYLIKILNTHLFNRTFNVKIGEFVTANTSISCGLPQGGVLSPILFSIYINDIPIKDNNEENSLLFADDLVETYAIDKINQEINNKINENLTKLEEWLNNWRLKMAPEKCSYMIFSKNKKTGYNEKLNLIFYNQSIPMEADNNVRFLGIRFDKHFSFKNQIKYLLDTCADRLNVIKVLAHKSWNINKETLTNIYKSLVRSIIDYSIYLYDILSDTNKLAIQRIQNKALRIIHNIKFDDHISTKQLHEIGQIETIEERARYINEKYLTDNIKNNNPLINKLIDEYELFNEFTNNKKHATLLDNWMISNVVVDEINPQSQNDDR
jgi:hypothetical protein